MKLFCSEEKYEYDTFLLVKEFFPREEIVRQNVSSDAFSMLSEEEEELRVIFERTSTRLKTVNGEEDKEYFFPLDEAAANPDCDSKTVKKAHMKNLYRGLHEITGIDLPWGNLTGVRPTKLARQILETGKNEQEAEEYYIKERFVSPEKRKLAIEIAKREIEILSSIDPIRGYSVYIGIPFCPSRCSYCSFLSNPIAKWQSRVEEYLHCIGKELRFISSAFAGRPLNTVYIGGGTPTALSAEELKLLMEMVNTSLELPGSGEEKRKDFLEFTVEAGRPDSITVEKLKVLRDAGVGRISVNPQTMHDETLQRIGRKHTVEQTLEAYRLARAEGFDNINMDLILGLPGETVSDVEKTMEVIKQLRPDSLTVHSLAMKRSSQLNQEKTVPGQSATEEESDPFRMMEAAYSGAKELNLHPYYLYRQKNIAGNLENVGFAKEGKYGIYNILMMEEVQTIVACGAGTVTKGVFGDGSIKRCDSMKDIGLYMENIDEVIRRKQLLFQ